VNAAQHVQWKEQEHNVAPVGGPMHHFHNSNSTTLSVQNYANQTSHLHRLSCEEQIFSLMEKIKIFYMNFCCFVPRAFQNV
jgi:hypothetical protein